MPSGTETPVSSETSLSLNASNHATSPTSSTRSEMCKVEDSAKETGRFLQKNLQCEDNNSADEPQPSGSVLNNKSTNSVLCLAQSCTVEVTKVCTADKLCGASCSSMEHIKNKEDEDNLLSDDDLNSSASEDDFGDDQDEFYEGFEDSLQDTLMTEETVKTLSSRTEDITSVPLSDKAVHMKRKSEGTPDSTDYFPGKKHCRTTDGSSNSTTLSNGADISQDSGILEAEMENEEAPVSSAPEKRTTLMKKRLTTRVNPPAELPTWLATFQTWSNAERLLAIDQLIETCEPVQVRHMMEVIEPQFQRDFISLLPKELALYVLSFLEPKDLLRAAQTCRYWRILAEDNLLWREKCREDGIEDVREVLGKRRARSSSTTNQFPPSILATNGIVSPSPWKAAYMRQHHIEMNWRCQPLRCPKVLRGHDDHVITCLQFSANKIVSGSDDNTLKVWNATTGRCMRTLMGHTGGVWSSQMSGNIIISGSTDRTLKVWNADTGTCTHTLYGHTSTVRCMHLHQNKVVSGSRDATLRVWDIDSGECLHVLVGHCAAVRCVQYNGKLVVSGAYDYLVKVWNPEREECLHTLQGHSNRVYSLQFDGLHVVSGSLDTHIRVWDVETGACKHLLKGHQSLTSGMELRNNILVSGNADSTVKVWDIITGKCLHTLAGDNKHQSAVTCLQFNSKFVITSSDDGTVKLWDLKTGDFIRNLVSLDSGGSGGVVWRIRASPTRLVCAVGSRNGTEETKLLVLDFDVEVK
ncbi:F-box/WD repeat-containing protein 7-like [Limulus polyphemus]|uniref:F-box/WD repeat-containing protein 7-like n=1 Tax=Limulus polyphemus TaxID=6850 RepID=A0ABM1SP48_LIMPO|nr:F-box/WD repeat-containing protein 7-like [Limulus polyphemus]XP_022245404.1 F-box/WD repeat-containing protein 7-like [Limulus polyphemus]